MQMSYRTVAAVFTAGVMLGVAGLTGAADAKPTKPPKSDKGTFFTGGNGTARWVKSTDGKVMQLSSPDGSSWAGFQGNAIDGVAIEDITALSYDFQVTSPGWTGGGGGSPRLVVEFSDGGDIALNPVTSLTTGTWVHMDAISGAVDNRGGSGAGCGSYQIAWSDVVTCHAGASVLDAFVVNDAGWIAPLTVQVDNLTLNATVYAG